MSRIFPILIINFLGAFSCFGQTATIKVIREFHSNSFDGFDKMQFEFNGVKFSAFDTVPRKVPLKQALDNGTAITGSDTLRFLTRFKVGNTYIIRPGCCCADFVLSPESKGSRGTVTFSNTTKRDLCLIVAYSNVDTIKAGRMTKIFASESAMCYYKPSSLEVVETKYFDEKYEKWYDNPDPEARANLKKEQETFLLSTSWFHFLHGEKIELTFNDKTRKVSVRLTGYLAQKELERF